MVNSKFRRRCIVCFGDAVQNRGSLNNELDREILCTFLVYLKLDSSQVFELQKLLGENIFCKTCASKVWKVYEIHENIERLKREIYSIVDNITAEILVRKNVDNLWIGGTSKRRKKRRKGSRRPQNVVAEEYGAEDKEEAAAEDRRIKTVRKILAQQYEPRVRISKEDRDVCGGKEDSGEISETSKNEPGVGISNDDHDVCGGRGSNDKVLETFSSMELSPDLVEVDTELSELEFPQGEGSGLRNTSVGESTARDERLYQGTNYTRLDHSLPLVGDAEQSVSTNKDQTIAAVSNEKDDEPQEQPLGLECSPSLYPVDQLPEKNEIVLRRRSGIKTPKRFQGSWIITSHQRAFTDCQEQISSEMENSNDAKSSSQDVIKIKQLQSAKHVKRLQNSSTMPNPPRCSGSNESSRDSDPDFDPYSESENEKRRKPRNRLWKSRPSDDKKACRNLISSRYYARKKKWTEQLRKKSDPVRKHERAVKIGENKFQHLGTIFTKAGKLYCCGECGYSTIERTYITKHIRSNHMSDGETSDNNMLPNESAVLTSTDETNTGFVERGRRGNFNFAQKVLSNKTVTEDESDAEHHSSDFRHSLKEDNLKPDFIDSESFLQNFEPSGLFEVKDEIPDVNELDNMSQLGEAQRNDVDSSSSSAKLVDILFLGMHTGQQNIPPHNGILCQENRKTTSTTKIRLGKEGNTAVSTLPVGGVTTTKRKRGRPAKPKSAEEKKLSEIKRCKLACGITGSLDMTNSKEISENKYEYRGLQFKKEGDDFVCLECPYYSSTSKINTVRHLKFTHFLGSHRQKLKKIKKVGPNKYLYANKYPFELNEAVYECSLCPFATGKIINVMNHMKAYHLGPDSGPLYATKTAAQDNSKIKKYRWVQISQNLFRCGKLTIEKIGEEDEYKCGSCEFTSPRLKMYGHLRCHLDGNTGCLKCKICGKQYNNYNSFKQHEANHDVRRRHKCNQCHQTYTSRDKLEQHLLQHETGVFSSSSLVQTGDNTYQYVNIKVTKNDDTFCCTLCPFTSPLRQPFLRHLRTRHMDRPKTCMCEICGKKFKFLKELNRHKVIHKEDRSHKCSKCQQSFKNLTRLYAHKRADHQLGKGNFVCHLCGKAFVAQYTLDKHILNHDDEDEKITKALQKSQRKSAKKIKKTKATSPQHMDKEKQPPTRKPRTAATRKTEKKTWKISTSESGDDSDSHWNSSKTPSPKQSPNKRKPRHRKESEAPKKQTTKLDSFHLVSLQWESGNS